MFASADNAYLPVFCTRTFHPKAWASDAFSIYWEWMDAYVSPSTLPLCLIHTFPFKLSMSRTRLLLIVTYWPRRPRIPLLLSHLAVTLNSLRSRLRAGCFSQDAAADDHPPSRFTTPGWHDSSNGAPNYRFIRILPPLAQLADFFMLLFDKGKQPAPFEITGRPSR